MSAHESQAFCTYTSARDCTDSERLPICGRHIVSAGSGLKPGPAQPGQLALNAARPGLKRGLATRVRTILVSGIEYRLILAASASIDICPILSLYSHAIVVSSENRYN